MPRLVGRCAAEVHRLGLAGALTVMSGAEAAALSIVLRDAEVEWMHPDEERDGVDEWLSPQPDAAVRDPETGVLRLALSLFVAEDGVRTLDFVRSPEAVAFSADGRRIAVALGDHISIVRLGGAPEVEALLPLVPARRLLVPTAVAEGRPATALLLALARYGTLEAVAAAPVAEIAALETGNHRGGVPETIGRRLAARLVATARPGGRRKSARASA